MTTTQSDDAWIKQLAADCVASGKLEASAMQDSHMTRIATALTTIDALSEREQADVLMLLRARYPELWLQVSSA